MYSEAWVWKFGWRIGGPDYGNYSLFPLSNFRDHQVSDSRQRGFCNTTREESINPLINWVIIICGFSSELYDQMEFSLIAKSFAFRICLFLVWWRNEAIWPQRIEREWKRHAVDEGLMLVELKEKYLGLDFRGENPGNSSEVRWMVNRGSERINFPWSRIEVLRVGLRRHAFGGKGQKLREAVIRGADDLPTRFNLGE